MQFPEPVISASWVGGGHLAHPCSMWMVSGRLSHSIKAITPGHPHVSSMWVGGPERHMPLIPYLLCTGLGFLFLGNLASAGSKLHTCLKIGPPREHGGQCSGAKHPRLSRQEVLLFIGWVLWEGEDMNWSLVLHILALASWTGGHNRISPLPKPWVPEVLHSSYKEGAKNLLRIIPSNYTM